MRISDWSSDVCSSDLFTDRDLALSNARRTARRRLLRRHIVGSRKYLGEPAWDMLIDLFIQHCEERKIATGDLCVSSALPLSTALRLVQRMCDDGQIGRASCRERVCQSV